MCPCRVELRFWSLSRLLYSPPTFIGFSGCPENYSRSELFSHLRPPVTGSYPQEEPCQTDLPSTRSIFNHTQMNVSSDSERMFWAVMTFLHHERPAVFRQHLLCLVRLSFIRMSWCSQVHSNFIAAQDSITTKRPITLFFQHGGVDGLRSRCLRFDRPMLFRLSYNSMAGQFFWTCPRSA